jgi:hypothetical protein
LAAAAPSSSDVDSSEKVKIEEAQVDVDEAQMGMMDPFGMMGMGKLNFVMSCEEFCELSLISKVAWV